MTILDTINTKLYTDVSTGELHERRFRVVVVTGPDRGKHLILDAGTTMIGAHPNNDLVLTDNKVSRYHLELQIRRDGVLIKDLNSTNGTTYRDTRLGAITVDGPARLVLGKRTEIDVEPYDEQVELDAYAGDRFGELIGVSAAMRVLFSFLDRVAPTDATLMLQGETGTGKEAVAEAVHAQSNRARGPFVVVDCGAIPHHLIGSELFGHVRGAFTGAASDKEGLIESASGGTLFLDEIGELAVNLQPQLLRVLEKREVRRVGGTRPVPVDIRIIAASHRDLRDMVKAGTFREDLYYRLAVVKTAVPPLRSRPEDIGPLADHFARQLGHGDFNPSPQLTERLRAHQWPGNVRELRNLVERALSLGSMASEAMLGLDRAPDAAAPVAVGGRMPTGTDEILDKPFKEAKAELIEGFEREYLHQLLERHKGNISRAAAEAGIDRNYIHRLIKKYDLKVERR